MPGDATGHDWELLDVTDETGHLHACENGRPQAQRSITRLRRARVSLCGREGVYLDRHAVFGTGELLRTAITMAGAGSPAPARPYGSCYPREPLPAAADHSPELEDLLGTPHALGAVRLTRTAAFSTRSGRTLSWQHQQTQVIIGTWSAHRPVPVACADPPNLTMPWLPAATPRPYADGVPWLLSPLALSGLLLTRLPPPGRTLVDGTLVIDRGVGPPTDFDGSPRHPITDTACSPPDTGLDGRAWRFDAHLQPGHLRSRPHAETACLVASARWMAGSASTAVLTVLGGPLGDTRPVSTLLTHLPHPYGMITQGDWVLPVQRGTGPWSSAWLELSEPAAALTIIHSRQS